jgi:hypothetical protein
MIGTELVTIKLDMILIVHIMVMLIVVSHQMQFKNLNNNIIILDLIYKMI